MTLRPTRTADGTLACWFLITSVVIAAGARLVAVRPTFLEDV
jgi:hypothetical protein